jgi:ankyrin repeat protein
MEMVRYLLSHGARVNVANKYGDTPLMVAIIRRRGEGVVKLLLDHGADVNSRDENGYTPLMMASRLGDMDIVSLLLQHRANQWIVGNDGETAYSLATSLGVKNLLGTQSSSLIRRRQPYNDISIHTYE